MINNLKKIQILCTALAILITVASGLVLPTLATQPEVLSAERDIVCTETCGEEGDLFYGYLQKQTIDGGISLFSQNLCESALGDELNKKLYRYLKSEIAKIAENGGSSKITVPESVFGGLSAEYLPSEDANTVFNRLLSESVQLNLIIDCLLADCPYELYWYDKTTSTKFSAASDVSSNTINVTSLTFTFSVAEAYRAEGYDAKSPAVTGEVSRVKTAAENARAIVSLSAELGDTEKLEAYKDYICDAVSYNKEAAESSSVPYGDPWQLIYVFDGDTDTNVVCEGYAKAFQYLCELSKFEGNVISYLVSGRMDGGTGAGGHMWNVVSMEETNYIVDITNSDEGSIGKGGELFMNAFPISGNAEGYIFAVGSKNVRYSYNDDAKQLYSEAVRTLGPKDPKDHKLTHHEAVAPDCCNEGNVEYWSCSHCNLFFTEELEIIEDILLSPIGQHSDSDFESDSEGHWHICEVGGATYGEEDHSGGNATCTEKARCEVCDAEYGELTEHRFTVLENDSTGHRRKCESCSETEKAEAHSFEDGKCTLCGYIKEVETTKKETDSTTVATTTAASVSSGCFGTVSAMPAFLVAMSLLLCSVKKNKDQ